MFTHSWPRKYQLIVLFTSTLLLVGCQNVIDSMGMRPGNLELPVSEILPADWRALGQLREISIDGDAQEELLLFYSYDNDPTDDSASGMGPIGALIYDIQTDAAYVTGNQQREYYPIPNQPSAYYVPYRILPNYWEPVIGRSSATTATKRRSFPQFIALPSVTDQDDIVVEIVRPSAADDLNVVGGDSVEGIGPQQEMIIRGGDTHITIVWWKNVFDGYGVVQLHAPYGFMDEDYGPGGVPGTNPIDSVTGAFPENDRSRFCRQVLYKRQLIQDTVSHDVSESQPPQLAVSYKTAEQGLHFCDEIPTHPFYPEGVVLAFLHDPDGHSNLIASSLSGERDIAALRLALEQRAVLNPNERVEAIYTRVDLPHLAHRPIVGEQNLGRVEGGPTWAWQTNVCVELVTEVFAADQAEAVERNSRQLRFRLLHEPPSLQDNRTDRWVIMGLVPESDILDNLDCYNFIQRQPLNGQ